MPPPRASRLHSRKSEVTDRSLYDLGRIQASTSSSSSPPPPPLPQANEEKRRRSTRISNETPVINVGGKEKEKRDTDKDKGEKHTIKTAVKGKRKAKDDPIPVPAPPPAALPTTTQQQRKTTAAGTASAIKKQKTLSATGAIQPVTTVPTSTSTSTGFLVCSFLFNSPKFLSLYALKEKSNLLTIRLLSLFFIRAFPPKRALYFQNSNS